MRIALSASLLLLLCLPSVGRAQERKCDLIESGNIDRTPELVTFHDPFYFRCTDGTELRAQQGTLNNLSRELNLVGNVSYRDPLRSLTAAQATYSNAIGRLYATGSVVFTDQTEGMTIRGPELEYYKAMEGRPIAQVNAGQRPHLTLRPKGRGKDDQPLEVDADRMTLLGRNDLSVYGNVIIQRPDLKATSGEARYDGNAESLELRQNGVIVSKEYTLRGEVIRARMPAGELEHVESRTRASVQGEDLDVRAPELQLFFKQSELQRTVARGSGQPGERALALSKTFRLEADSLDAAVPGQRVKEVVAIGNARGESIDTTRADSARAAVAAVAAVTGAAAAAPDELIARDWITGDTITGYFTMAADSAPRPARPAARGARPDTTTRVAAADSSATLERIVARGSAQSLYRVEAQEKSANPGRRGVNFLAGAVIELRFSGGELKVADVTGLRKGLYLEPAAAGARPAATPAASPPRRESGR